MRLDFAGKKLIYFLIFSAFLFALTANELNLRYIKTVNPDNKTVNMVSTVGGYTVWSNDNSWYLPQIKNILNGDGYTSNPRHPEFKVRRTPGYPLFYGLHYVLFGEENSFFFIRYTQILIHLLAVLLLGQAVFNFSESRRWAIFAAFLYALNPYTVIYLYTTITEGIAPAFVVFALFAYSLCYKSPGLRNYFILGIIIGAGLLVRPLLIVLLPSIGLAVLIQQIIQYKLLGAAVQKTFYNLLFVAIGTGTILAPWAVRNYIVTGGELILLEKYYDDDPMGYGRGHSAFRDWISCWDNPANTSAEDYADSVKAKLKENAPVETAPEEFLAKVPPAVFTINSKESVADALGTLNECFREKQETLKINPSLTRQEARTLAVCENQVTGKFNNLTSEFKSKGFLRYYVLTSLIFLKNIVLQSNSHMVGMLAAPFDSSYTIWQKAVKSLMYLLNVLLFASLIPLILVNIRSFSEIKIFIVSFILITGGLCVFYFRYSEARYYIPCVPLLCASLAYVFSRLFAEKTERA